MSIKFNGNTYKVNGMDSIKYNDDEYSKPKVKRLVIVGGAYSYDYYSENLRSWHSMSGLESGNLKYNLVCYGDNLFLCRHSNYGNGYTYTSTNGTSWTKVNSGFGTDCNAICYKDGVYIVAYSTSGMYKSTNNGTNWSKLTNAGPTATLYGCCFGEV